MKKRARMLAFILAGMTTFSSIPAIALPVAAETTVAETTVVKPTVDYRVNPIGIAPEDVAFSWAMGSAARGAEQKAYRILVHKGSTDGAIVWDSGFVEDGTSVGKNYGGTALENETRYFWTVTIKDQNGGEATSDVSYFETATDMSDAKWIYADDISNGAPMFRTEQKAENKKIAKARLYITAMGVYDAFINGNEVTAEGKDDIFNPGWTDYDKYVNYQTYDVTDLVSSNQNNTIGVLVGGGWYQTNYGSNYSKSFGPDDNAKERGLLAKMVITYEDGTTSTVVTNGADWKYSDDSAITSDDFFNGEDYNAQIAQQNTGWNENGFDVSAWSEAKETEYKNHTEKNGAEVTGQVKASARAEAYFASNYDKTPIDAYTYNDAETTGATGTTEGLTYGKVTRHPVDVNGDMTVKAGDKLIVDMGQNMVGQTDTVMTGEAGTKVTFRFAEALNDGRDPDGKDGPNGSDGPEGSLYRIALRSAKCTDTYIMCGDATEEYQQTMTYRGFRYVEISADKDITVHSIKGKVITSVGEETGSLTTSDKDVNQLISNSKWSEMGNYLSIPTDCPQRDERAGWTGDIQLFANTATLNFDVNADLENYIEIMNEYAKNNDNRFGPVMPLNGFFGSFKSCGWSDCGVILPWVMYLQTGDEDMIRNSMPYMDKYMDSTNGIEQMTDKDTGYNGIMFGDWLAYSGTSIYCMNQLYRYYSTKLMLNMATIIQNEALVNKYTELEKKYREQFQAKYIDADGNLLSSSADGITEIKNGLQSYEVIDNAQTGLLWTLKLGLYKDDEQKKIMVNNLIKNIHNENGSVRKGQEEDTLSVGFLGVNVILPVLSDIGESETAYTLLLQDCDPSWLYAVKNGATTTWERWNSYSVEDGFGNSSMNSFNHFSYGAPVEWIYNYMAGISRDEANPGYKHIILQPVTDPQGRITSADGSYDSLYGEIKSSWQSDEKGNITVYKATVPANTTATLYLNIDENQAEKALEGVEGATFTGIEKHNGSDCAKIEMEAGTYDLTIPSADDAALALAKEAKAAAEEAQKAAEEAKAAAEAAQTQAAADRAAAEKAQQAAEAAQKAAENAKAAAEAAEAQASQDKAAAEAALKEAQKAAEEAKAAAKEAKAAAEEGKAPTETPGTNNTAFKDVSSGAYYNDAVLWAVQNGITKGTSDTTFSPEITCTRAQAITFLWRAAGSPAPKTKNTKFADVAENAYYHDAVLWALENGITVGTSDTTFSPNATCTRAQIVSLLWRSQQSPAAESVSTFSDVKSDAYYNGAVQWAFEKGITVGTSADKFSPDASCTRAQIVTFMWRLMK